MIDPNDPAQMMHGGVRIPIDTAEAIAATRDAAMAIYEASGRLWDNDAQEQLERRILNGQTTAQVITHTLEDRKARFDE